METTTISTSIFEAKAKEAIETQPLRRQISLSEIELIGKNSISVEGQELSITDGAFKDLIEVLKVPKAFLNRFKDVFGEENQKTFINRLRESASVAKGIEVTLIADPKTRKVSRMLGADKALISNDSAVDFARRYIDSYGLGVNSFNVDTNGSFSINTTSPTGYFSVKGLKDESFQGGVTFTNTPERGLEILPYLQRLICANGMIGRQMAESYRLNSLSQEAIEKFNEQMLQLQAMNFTPMGFSDRIHKAAETKASFREMQSAVANLLSNSKASYDQVQKWIPLQSVKDQYTRTGYDTNRFTTVQGKNALTNMSINDLYNAMTNFASHDHKGIEIEDGKRSTIMVGAGNLLWKPAYDVENFIPSPFYN